MTKKNNVKESAKTKMPLHSDSTADQRTKRKTKNKLRLHSKLKVNVPLSQSLMLILPSLAKHVSASPQEHDVQDTPNDVIDSEEQRSQEDMNLLAEEHPKSDIIENTAPSDKAKVEDANSEQSQNSTLTPSHHLSSLSHPQVHYVPAISIPTISSGQVPQPTTHTPVTPDLPVTFLPEVISGKYGELHVDANGHYTFVLNPLSPQYVLLHQNQPGTDQFMLHLSNGSQLVVQIPVAGKQDIPTISGDLRGVVIEDHNVDSHGLLSASGKIDVVDPDHDQSSVTAETITGQYGSLSIDANGKWHYQVDNSLSNVQALTSLTSLHESFTIHTKDGTPQTIEMTIGGNDDNAIVSGVDAGSVTEDQTTQVHGQLTVTDSDLGQDHFQASLLTGQFGTLVLSKDGAWTYNLDNWNPAVQALGQGSTATDTITVHSADGTPHQITIAVNGTNDNPVVSSYSPNLLSKTSTSASPTGLGNAVFEDINVQNGHLHTGGQLYVDDRDSNESEFLPESLHGTYGELKLTSQGTWSYIADNNNPVIDRLNIGDTLTEHFQIHTKDGSPFELNVYINGNNDSATVSSISVAVDETDKAVTTSGTLTSTDVDNPDNTFRPDSISGTNGDLTIDANGHWTFTANSAFNQLNVGDKVEETFTVSSVDGTPSTIKVTINGTNDAATVSTTAVSVDETDKAVTTSGMLTSTDVDNPDNAFTPDSITGTNGDLTIDANGHWVFTANSAFNQLNVGDKVEETFTVSSVDGTPSTIKVTINGTNDTATVSNATVAIDETDKAVTTSGTLTSTDVDNPDNAFTPNSISGTNGDLTIDANGHWNFTANSAFNQLNVGDKVEETFTVSSIDGTPSTIKVTINGTNDAATVSSATVAIDETDKAVTTSGTLTSTDVDNPDNTFAPDSISGTNGDLTIDANGHWVFTANSAFNQLNVGDKVEETFTVSSIDGTPSTIKVTINGTNDTTTVSSATIAIDETDKAVTTSGTLTSTDVDNPDNAFTPDSISGTNGDLTIDANGHWVFTANSAFNQLNIGDKVEETFTVSSVDGTPSTIKVTINGTNDTATVSSATVAIDETDKAVTTSGTLTSTDVDNPDNTFTPDSITGSNGDLTIDANGHWTFTANSAFNQLNVGDKVEETFTVSSIDGTPSTIKVTINGTNDAATVSSATVAIDETNKAVTTSGTLTSTDVDNPDNAFTPNSISGTNGDLTIDTNGHWVFTANSAFNQLNVGDKVEETFTVSSIDGTPSTIKVTINGTNDTATVSSATVAIDETDKAVTTSGTLTSTDVDNPDNTFTPDSISGTNGDLTIDTNGHWTFTANSAFNQLNVGDKVEETFTVSSVDGTPSTIKVTINGTNDKATVSSSSVAIDETDKAVTTSGTLTSTDVDNPDNTFTPDSITGSNGDLTIDANGHWTFTANSAFNQLNVGDKVEETFTVSSIDGTPSTIKVTINGTNDAATVSSATVAIDETNKAVTTSGTLTSTDVDNPDNAFTPNSISGTNGDLTIDTNGHWVFTANSAFNQLNVGDKVEETFTVSSIDGTPSTIKVTINGTNDTATVSSATVAIDETDKAVTTSGTLTSTDVDNPDNTFTPDSISGTNGDLTIDTNGHWTFTANSAFNQLNVGDKVEETFTVSSVDGTPSTIKVTINGTNDKATVSSSSVAIDETDKAVTTSGTLTSTDVDNPDNTFTPDSISGTNGDLTIDANGHWIFTANSAFNQLNVGDKVEETFTVSSVDGTPSTIKVTINGTNDKATVSSATVAIDETDKAVTTSGTLTSTDVDNPDNAFTPNSISGTNGDLTIDTNGHWVFTANSAFNQLNVGDKVEETFTVSSIDGTPSTIKVTINGTNDTATVSSATVAIDETDKAVTTSGTLTSTDVDNPDNTFTPDSISGTNGDLTIDTNGHWTFTANSAFNQLNVGDKVEETFTVSSVDGTPSTIKVTINGTNDKATVSSSSVAIDETDKAVTTSGTLTSTDVDNPDNTFTPDSISGTNGDLTIDANGHWIFTANSAFNQLNVGDKVEETFTVSSVDGTPSTIKVTINGTNDKATVSSATVAIDETDKAVTTSGTLTSTDVDNPDNTFTPDSISGTNGGLTIDANGHWNFTANSAFNQLNVGDKVEETFTVSSVDGTPSTIKVTINGTNDKATVSSATVAIDETDKAVTTSGTLTSTDVDNPDNTFTPDSISGTNGGLTIDANGHWNFTANSAFNQLNVGDKVEETFTVSSVDGTPSTIKVTINGTNDKATVSSATVAIDETDKAVTTSGTLTSTDVDNPDNAFTPNSISGTNGDLTIDANGHWNFIANSAFNQLNVGDKVEETFTVSSIDGTPSTIKVTINGTNDAATVSTTAVSVDETDKAVTTSGMLTSTDVDNPDNAFTPDSITGTNGGLTIDANGHWTFTANNAFNQLNVGDKVEETFTVSSVDGTPSTIKVTINGTNDAATVSTTAVSVDETDKAVTTSGMLTSTDVDNPDNTFKPDSISGTNGDLTIDANGHWTFTANNAFNQLNVGDKVEETFTVSSIDGTSSTIKVMINGTNDKAVISGTSAGTVTEESQLHTSGTLTVTDVDTGEAHFSNSDIVGALGTLHLTDTGGWTYDLDNTNPTVQALGKGATTTDTITVHSADGTPHQITITVNGTNDTAVIGGQDTGSVDEGHGHYSDMSPDYGKTQLTSEALYADGKLTIADPDTGENEFDPKGGGYDYQGQYGRVNLHQDGTWHYMVDIGHNGFTSGTSTTSVGTTIDQLGDGQSLTDTITVYSKDGTSHDIVVTIHGDNDRPYCSSEVQLNSGKEDLAQTITATELLANTIDVDTNDIGKLTIANLHADHGSVVDNKDGTYTFTPTKDYNGQVHFNYDVTDAHGGITATGANLHLQATGDAATINGIDQGNVTEDRGYIDTQYNLHFDGKLDIVDPDQGEAQFDIQRGHTYHGIGYDTKMGGWVLLQQDGTYTYTIDNRKPEIQNLGSTETLVDKVTIHSVDGTSHEVQITIHGTNDDPKVSSVTTLPAGTEDTDVVLHASDLLTNATDIDHNDAGQLSVANLTADHGKITDNHDGTFTFHPTQDYNGKVSFTYDVQDAHGGSVATSASITLAPIRDSAVISGDDTGSIIEDRNVGHSSLQPVAASGLLSVTDPDAGQDHFQVNRLLGEQAIHDPFGGFLRITPSGAWGYEVANSRLQSLAEGEVEKVVYRVYSADHTAHDITITVTGTNDKPTITATTLAHGTEDTHYQMQASQFGFTDIDTGDTLHSIAITDLPPATQGKFLLNGHDVTAGQHIPTADISKLQFVPAQDFNGDVQFKYTVNDGHVDSLETTNTLHIDPVADAATFTGDSGSISEDTNIHHNVHTTGSATIPSALVCNGHLVISDVDGQGEAALDLQGQQHVSQDGTYGHFTVTSRGIWVYTADNNSTSIQDLDNGQTLTDSIEVTSKDGTKHSITVTINGTTDAPTLHSLSDSGVQHSGPVEGNLLTGSGTDQGLSGAATDTDSNAHLVLQDIQIKDPVSGYVAVRPGQPHTMAGIGTLAIEANGHYTFTPEVGFTGKVPSMVYRVGDDGGNPIGDSSQNSLSIEVTPPLQHTPTVTGQTVSTNEDITKTITTSEFGYSDQDGDALQFVTISSIPSHGLLLLNGNAVTANQQISKADLDAGHLTFTPINNGNGANYAQFTFTANDGHKNSASATMVVDVNAVNDAPIVGSSFVSSLEDKPHAFTTADFKYSDIDGDALNHITITNVAHGVLSLNGTTVNVGDDVSASDVSSLIFTPTHNYFSSGVSGLGAVQFTANDGHLDSKEGSILINIASVADPATFSGDSTGVTKEDITLQASGTLTASDPDGTAGFTAAQGGAGIAGSKGYGHAHIDVNGHWTYDLDNNHPIVQQLGEGQTDTETITVQSTDGTHHDIVVTITGTNDAPILGVNQTSSTTGTLTETDVDVTDSHTFSVVSSAGQFGSLSVDPNTGDYVYTPNTSITGMSYNSATNSYHGVDIFEVKVSDGHTEDSKFITFDASGHVTMSPTGGLVISTTVPQQPTVTTTLPTMQMVTNVAPTNSVTLDLASTSDSGSSNTDNITNDTTPTITGHTDIPFSKVTIYDGSTPVGHAVSDASGQYNVVVSSLPNGDHNLSAKALAPSSTLPATSPALSVHVDTDIAPLQVSLTHDTGRSTSDLITSDGVLTISGQETGATIEYSIDGGHTWSNTFTPQTGSNTVEVRQTDTAGNISTSSSLTFTLDNTVTAPSVSLTSDSGGSSSDKITNIGDLSVGGIEQGATVEYSIDNGVHWSTQFTPAEGQNNVQVRQTDVAGNVSPSTSLSYTLDTQIDIRVNSAHVDQHGQGMMVQVYLPKDSEVTLLEITSDGGGAPLLVDLKTVQRQGMGTSVSHPDHQYQEFVGIDLSSLPDGNLSIRVAGTDTAGNTVTAQSSASSNYILDTTASASDDSNTAIEDSTIPVSGNLLSNDADAATVTTTGDIQGTYGLFHLNKDGSYTYTLDNQLSTIQQLNSTSTPLVDSITYTASDSHGNLATAHLAISIQGTDDNHPPAVTGQTLSTNEDTTKTFTTSEFGYSDQDGDALQFVTISSIPSHGLLLLNGKAVIANQQISKAELDAGHLTFTPINNENGANYAQFTFTANDGHQNSASATMILNVNAVNDAPIVGSSFISSLEDKPHAFTTADFKYSDIDGDALNHITITNVAHGVLTLNGATVNVGDDVSASDISSLIFTPTHNYFSSNINGLGAVQFTANDGHIDSKEGSIFINIADVADPATFGGDSTGAAQEDTTLQASGTLTASDPDGTVGFIAVQGGVGIVGSKGYGHAHIDSNGHWTYDLYNKHPIVQQLGQGQTDTETITIQSADGTQHDIVITITGTNDLPTVSEKPQAGHIIGQHSVDEDSNLNPAGQLIINDVDGDTTNVALDPTHSAAYGHVVFDAHSGTWVYHLDNSNPTVNALNDNDTLQDKFTLLVDDGHGQKVPQEITMTINGHTDPVPYAPPTISVMVDTRHAHHVTAGITPSTLQAYAHSIRGHATTVSGSHEIKGHGHSDIIIVSGRLHEEAELEGGNDILFLGGRLTDKEIEGGHGSDTLILGAYNRNNAPRLHDHGEKISDGHEEMELESIENIILGDGTVLKGHLPANFPLVTHDHYEVPVNIQAHLSSGDESVSSIRLTHLQQGLTLQSNGHNINANHDGSYTVPANGHLVVVSDHPMNNGHHYFETEVTTHNSVTGVTAVTTEDLQGHIQSHVNPPPPPPPPVQHDEPDSPLTFEASVTIVDDSNTQNEQQHVGVTDSQHHDVSHHGAAAYLDALGITPDATSTTVHDQPADMDIVLAQVDHPDTTTHDQAHLDMSDALEHHDANVNHNQDDEHHHHNDVDGLPDIDPNS
ncbi:VCBS domain-containing protein [Vibrio lentus]|uniref:VCBS domain-containing protein n=3 Tax=Vibrio TaxID=662 RepID=UPI002479D5E1|nr:VCBS domain-containing protein [Vibrio lentus]WGS63476.1 VCBS domain-containing protein [Vibrio lentus]